MADQLSLTQVQYGCAVTAQGSPNMTVAVAAGSVLVGNVPASVAAGNQTITAADAALDRVDSIVVNSSGTVSVLTGTLPAAGDNPQPASSAGYALLATIYVLNQADPNYTGTITNTVITDQRGSQTQSGFALIHTSPYKISSLWYGPQNLGRSDVTWANNEMYLVPYFTAKNFAVQAIGVGVNGAGTTGSKARLGIYSDDGAGGLTLLVDAGQVAVDVNTTYPSVSISQTLTPGWWWFACAFQSLGVTKPSMFTANCRAVSPLGASALSVMSLQTNGSYGAMRFTGISGALPSSPSSPDYSSQAQPTVWVQAT